MKDDMTQYHQILPINRKRVCEELLDIINRNLNFTESKVWHSHPVWFINGNPVVGYSSLKDGIRLMFWSGADFNEDGLQPGTGKFKDASVVYTHESQIDENTLKRWLKKSEVLQWDYKNVVKNNGRLSRI